MQNIYIYIIVSILLVVIVVSNIITINILEKSNQEKIIDNKNSLERSSIDTKNSLEKSIIDTKNTLEKLNQDKMIDTKNSLEKSIIDTKNSLEKSNQDKLSDTKNNLEKSIIDTKNNLEKSIRDKMIVITYDKLDTNIVNELSTKIDRIDKTVDNKIDTMNTVINNIKGIIVMWSGNITNIPGGWAFCNGEKYKLNSLGMAIVDNTGTLTPDLRSRFIVGAARDNDLSNLPLANGLSTYSVKTTGGAEKVTLSKDQMPSHNHDIINILNQGVGCYGTACSHKHPISKVFPLIAKSGEQLIKKTETDLSFSDNISGYARPSEIPTDSGFSGSSLPHENMPPYYALAYIMKL